MHIIHLKISYDIIYMVTQYISTFKQYKNDTTDTTTIFMEAKELFAHIILKFT